MENLTKKQRAKLAAQLREAIAQENVFSASDILKAFNGLRIQYDSEYSRESYSYRIHYALAPQESTGKVFFSRFPLDTEDLLDDELPEFYLTYDFVLAFLEHGGINHKGGSLRICEWVKNINDWVDL